MAHVGAITGNRPPGWATYRIAFRWRGRWNPMDVEELPNEARSLGYLGHVSGRNGLECSQWCIVSLIFISFWKWATCDSICGDNGWYTHVRLQRSHRLVRETGLMYKHQARLVYGGRCSVETKSTFS
jgi:hypothetical protein